jgi:hypothetical protein
MFHRHHDADGGQLKPGREQQWEKIIGNVVGDVRGFVVNPASGETRFDMTDGRNSWAVQNAATDATCPTCGAPVDQASAAMDLAPHCAFCHQPLPAQPRARC